MTLGTLYIALKDGEPKRTRAIVPEGLVKYFKLDVKVSGPDEVFPSKFAAGPFVPAFQFADGKLLTESIPITLYLVEQVPNNGHLLGDGSAEQRASILSWMSFMNWDFMGPLADNFKAIVGRSPYNKEVYDANTKKLAAKAKVLNDHLTKNTFLVGEKLSLADLYGIAFLLRGLEHLFGTEWRKEHRAIWRWYNTVSKSPIFFGFFDNVHPIDVPNHPENK